MAGASAGTVTFLFTDLEGSTRLWEEDPSAMQPALARHDEILRRAIESHGGRVVKTTGDGVHGAFADPVDAVQAAVAAQLELVGEEWPSPEPLRVRMGVHTGVAEERDGDYYGPVLNRAARLMSVAHGNQIVISQVTEELVRDTLDDHLGLVDLGQHRLRDLASPMGVFQVAHPELPADFLPLRSLEHFAGNLPLQLTSFVGRDADVAAVTAATGTGRLVTLTGPGGVGKTRLALQAAADLVPDFPDGAWFCELAPVNDATAMAQVVATTLGCVQRTGLTMAESAVEYLKPRRALVILDNCEHLLDDAGEFAESVLRSCPETTIIATSREALDVAGERVTRVRSLPVPEPEAAVDRIAQNDAVRMFVDRAVAAGAQLSLQETNAATISEICRRVDGIPLAIELAAARAGVMSVKEIAARLDERFRLLTGQRRGRVERHRTLRATVEWSYQLLGDDERLVFDRLGVLTGSFDADAARAIVDAADLDAWTVIDAVSGLVSKSMLTTEEDGDGTTRYAMLETLRQYALERLDETGELDACRQRHAVYYAGFAERLGPGFRGPEEREYRRRWATEIGNLRAAVMWGVDQPDPRDQELAVRISTSIGSESLYERMTTLGPWARQALSVADACPPDLRRLLLVNATFYAMDVGERDEARRLAQEALQIEPTAHAVTKVDAQIALAYVEIIGGNNDRAIEVLLEALAILGSTDADPWELGHILGNLGCFEGMRANYGPALGYADRALEIARAVGAPSAIAFALHATAWACWRDDPPRALAASNEAIELHRSATALTGTFLSTLGMRAALRARAGDFSGAWDDLIEAVQAHDFGERPQLGATLAWGATVLEMQDRHEAAAVIVGALSAGVLASVTSHPNADRSHGDYRVAKLRSQLGDRADAAIRRGATMSYDEVMAYGLEQFTAARTELASRTAGAP